MNKDQANKLANQYRLSYFTSRYWLEFVCEYKNINGEDVALIKALNSDEYIFQYPPKKISNLKEAKIQWATQEEIDNFKDKVEILEQKEVMSEYFYQTKDIIELKGPGHKKNRQAINTFEKKYNYKIVNKLDKDKIVSFLNKWDQKQELKTAPYERGLKFCHFLLDYLDKDEKLKSVFVLVDDQLVGMSIGELVNEKGWIAIHQKVDYNYKGLGRWIFRERAKLFKDVEEFANGGAMGDQGIVEYKNSLRPSKVVPYYYLELAPSQ